MLKIPVQGWKRMLNYELERNATVLAEAAGTELFKKLENGEKNG